MLVDFRNVYVDCPQNSLAELTLRQSMTYTQFKQPVTPPAHCTHTAQAELRWSEFCESLYCLIPPPPFNCVHCIISALNSDIVVRCIESMQ